MRRTTTTIFVCATAYIFVTGCSNTWDTDSQGGAGGTFTASTTTSTGAPEDTPDRCTDGFDNDGDGLVDCADADCVVAFFDTLCHCGNGVVEPGETCDGNCPASCDDFNNCTVDSTVGSPADCNIQCEHTSQQTCSGGDNCCPSTCTTANDSDCAAPCGNGLIDPGETCDGNCPMSCDDGLQCTTDSKSGSSATCDVVCTHVTIATCFSGDGCCAVGCNSANDTDCSSSCGNSVVEPPLESCDGNCPQSCDDGNFCTLDTMSGSPQQCNVVCAHAPISACNGNDGCCPANCTANNDSNCSQVCGNNVVEGSEQCDGSQIPNSCLTYGFTTGQLSCSASCSTDTSTCCPEGGCSPDVSGDMPALPSGYDTSDLDPIPGDIGGNSSFCIKYPCPGTSVLQGFTSLHKATDIDCAPMAQPDQLINPFPSPAKVTKLITKYTGTYYPGLDYTVFSQNCEAMNACNNEIELQTTIGGVTKRVKMLHIKSALSGITVGSVVQPFSPVAVCGNIGYVKAGASDGSHVHLVCLDENGTAFDCQPPMTNQCPVISPQCGGQGQSCCVNGTCNNGLTCSAGTCQTCPSTQVIWTARAPLDSADPVQVSTALAGKIHVFGWNSYLKHREFNPSTNQWTNRANLQYAIDEGVAEVVNSKIFGIGYGLFGGTYAMEWNAAADTWINHAANPFPRDNAVSGVIGNKIYVSGGFNSFPEKTSAYDTVSDQWTSLANMPAIGGKLTGGVYNGKLYIFGTNGNFNVTKAQVFDPAANSWTVLNSAPVSRYAAKAIVVGSLFWLMGGTENGTPKDSIYFYNTTTNSWCSGPSLPEAMYAFSAAQSGGKIYLVGGYDANSAFSSHVWEGTVQ